MDRISLRGLRAMGVHGVLPEERDRAQPFELDLDVEADLTSAGRSDRLDDTLDYGRLVALAASVVSDESHALLERIAARVTEVVLDADERVQSVTVTVWKLRPPVPNDLDRAGVTITRSRA